MKMHESITVDRLLEMAERRDTTLDDPGVCTSCGQEVGGCEPDARKYECECCGERAVYAPEELLTMIAWRIE